MRRVEIVQAVQNVAEALVSSHVMSALARMDTTELVCAHADWVARRQSFGAPEDRVIGVLGLEQLDDPAFWAKALSEGANRDPEMLRPISEMHRNARFAQDELPKLLSALLVRESDAVVTGEGIELPGRLTVLVLEDGDSSTPERLALVLNSIGTLYSACAQILAEPNAHVSVVACDSGGDKSFDFLGNVRVIERVRDVVLSFWDRVVFFREDRTEDRMKLIAESLPVADEVEELAASGSMSRETADTVKQQVAESIFMFGRAGATIPEFQQVAVYNPRELMRPTSGMIVAEEGSAEAAVEEAAEPAVAEPTEAESAAPEPTTETSAASEADSIVETPAAVEAETPPAAEESETPAAEEAAQEPDGPALNGTDLQRIIAEKVDKVLHGQPEDRESGAEKDEPAQPESD
jgi:hypothetical protein